MQGLDATIRALQNAANVPDGKVSPQDVHTRELQDASIQVDNQTALSQPAMAAGNTENPQQQLQPRPHSRRSATTSPSTSAATAAALLQQQAEQLSRLIAEHKLGTGRASPPEAALTPAVGTTSMVLSTPASSCGSTSAAKQAEHLPITPLVLPSHCNVAARGALHDLAQWQLQQGLVAPEQAVGYQQSCKVFHLLNADSCEQSRMCCLAVCLLKAEGLRCCCSLHSAAQVDTTRKVLQYDPAIGSHGAFIIKDLPESTLPAVDPRQPLADHNSKLCIRDTGHNMSCQQVVQTDGHWQHPMSAAGQALPFPRHPGSPFAREVSNSSHVDEAAAVNSLSLRPGAPGLSGLCDASPWEDSTSKQLLNLADAFNSLAVLSPASAAARGQLAPDSGSQDLTADTSSITACRTLPFIANGTAASGVCNAAPANDVAGISIGSLSVEAAPAAEQSVQEVPVESVDAWQVPVVVQNEKSLSSLGGSRSQLTSPAQQQQNGVQGSLPAYTVLPEGQQQYLPLYQPNTGQQELAENCVTAYAQPLQRQQQHACLAPHQLGGTISQQPAQTLLVTESRAPENISFSHQLSAQQYSRTGPPSGQWLTHEQHRNVLRRPEAAAAEQEEWVDGMHVRVADQFSCNAQPCSFHQQNGHLIADYADVAASTDTQELLERFDESLVDLLMEVERLEQQHLVCKRQMMQGTTHPQRKLPRQHRQQHWSAVPDTQQVMDVSLDAAQGQSTRNLHMQQPQLQPVQQKQHRSQSSQQQLAGNHISHWQQQQVDEDDVVSDILNHLD